MSKGYMIIKTITSNAKIPIQGSNIALYLDDERNLLGLRESNINGSSEIIEVETPDKSLSTSPSEKQPFTKCVIHVTHENYYNTIIRNVQVFPDTTSIQEVRLIPLEENAPPEDLNKTFIITAQDL